MAHVYSAYEAKAKFSEMIRRVRAGQRVIIAYRGREVAEISPVERGGSGLEQSLERLEDLGVVSRGASPARRLKRLVKRPGALERFLESRE